MVAALTTDACWIGQFRTQSGERRLWWSDRPVNSGFATPYYITLTPCIDIDFGGRPYFFYSSLCINYLLCNIFLIPIITIIPGLHYFLCTGK